MTFRKSTICCHQPRVAVSNHWTPLAITPQPGGGLDCPEGLNDPLSQQLQWTSAEARDAVYAILLTVTTCASGSRSGMWRNPTGDDWVSSVHECGSGVKVVSSMTVLAHQFPPPLSSGC